MQFDFPWYSLIFMAGTILTLALAFIISKRQFARGVNSFTLFLLSLAVWTFSAALESGAVEISDKILFSKAEYIAVVSTGTLSLIFILEYIRSTWIKRKRNLILLWIVPAISLILVWTNELHYLVWPNIYIIHEMGASISVWEHGPGFWFIAVYQYILFSLGIIILIHFAIRGRGIYRKKVNWLLAASFIPVAGSLVYVTGLSPVKGLDLTPVSICLMGVIYSITIIQFQFMDILPAATTAFVKKLPDGFLLLDAEGIIIDLNPAVERILGRSINDLKEMNLISLWPELGKIAQVGYSSQNRELESERSGQKAYLQVSIESFIDRYGTLTGKLIILRDITELKIIQKQLENEIQKHNQFSRAIVHELRNPLTAIISSTSLLEDPRSLTDEMKIALAKNIGRASSDLEKRVNELFELARGESGLLEIQPETVDMNGLISEVTAEMEPIAVQKGLKINCVAGKNDDRVRGDKNRLRQVLFNLLNNSLKYTVTGQITIKSQSYKNNLLLVQVEDTGKGIGKEDIDNLFDPYLRSPKLKGSSTGLGIGLALSKYYIELHKGTIWAESTPEKGTTISFTVPLIIEGKSN